MLLTRDRKINEFRLNLDLEVEDLDLSVLFIHFKFILCSLPVFSVSLFQTDGEGIVFA